MSVAPLAVEITCVCCLAAFLLHRYGDWRKQHVLVTLATFIAWYFSFMIIFVLPLDVSSTCYRQCLRDRMVVPTTASTFNMSGTPANVTEFIITREALDTTTHILRLNMSSTATAGEEASVQPSEEVCKKPWSYVAPYILPSLWHVVYWTSQVLTWIILPMMQSYATAGDFTVAGKIKSALIENAIYYGTYLLIFGVCLIYVAVQPGLHIDGSQLKVIGITASNTWGLFLLVLLLGYGLVEVPRTCWYSSKRGYLLPQTYFKIAKLSTEKSESEENLEDVLDDVKKASDTIRYNHPLRKHVDTILKKCPESMQKSVKKNVDDYEDFNNPTETPTEKSLVRLHKKVINNSQNFRRTHCQWNMLMEKAFDLEDIAANEVNTNRKFVRSMGKYDGVFRKCYSASLEWYWKCVVCPWGLKVLTVLLAIFSFMVVWSEVLFFNKKPVLSLFAIFIQLAKRNYDYFYIELASCITISYLCICAYYTIFKIRVFNYYYLASHHQTDENSLLFSGILLCRLTPPMCLNFLGLIHLDTHITQQNNLEETSYTEIMGHMDVISFISGGFNIYFPICIVLLCIATYFNLGSRCLHFLGFQQFVGDDDITQEFVDEGKELVKRERRRRERIEDGEARRRNWNERFGENATRGGGARNDDNDGGSRKRPGKYQAPHSPDENDRTELLKQVEPVDYMGDSSDVFDEYSDNLSVQNTDKPGRYQSRPARPDRFPSSRPGTAPPKGIFDDV